MIYSDLSPWTGFGADSESWLAVGWLGAGVEAGAGRAPDFELFEALVALLKEPWQPALALGVHRCELCVLTHYMDSHAYRPPAEFRAAVFACPPLRSMEYLKKIRALGLHKLAAPGSRC